VTLTQRVEHWKDKFDNDDEYGEVEAFLSLYYLATFMAEALRVIKEHGISPEVDRILAQDEEER